MSTFNDNNYFNVTTLPDTIILLFLLIEKWTVTSLRYKKKTKTWNKIRSAHIILPRFYYFPLSCLLEFRCSEIPSSIDHKCVQTSKNTGGLFINSWLKVGFGLRLWAQNPNMRLSDKHINETFDILMNF